MSEENTAKTGSAGGFPDPTAKEAMFFYHILSSTKTKLDVRFLAIAFLHSFICWFFFGTWNRNSIFVVWNWRCRRSTGTRLLRRQATLVVVLLPSATVKSSAALASAKVLAPVLLLPLPESLAPRRRSDPVPTRPRPKSRRSAPQRRLVSSKCSLANFQKLGTIRTSYPSALQVAHLPNAQKSWTGWTLVLLWTLGKTRKEWC